MSAACKWLDVAKAVQSIPTDYALAKRLEIGQSRISGYRSGRVSGMDDDLAIRVAEMAEVSPAVVLAELAAERSKSPKVRAAWLSLAKVAKHAA